MVHVNFQTLAECDIVGLLLSCNCILAPLNHSVIFLLLAVFTKRPFAFCPQNFPKYINGFVSVMVMLFILCEVGTQFIYCVI
jgi:hypothetical protein